MSDLPSYEQATAKQDWLTLVAPYVQLQDYTSLCLTSHECWNIFAPRMWWDVLYSVHVRSANQEEGKRREDGVS